MPQNPAIAAFAAAQTEYQNTIDTAVDGLSTDIAALLAKIEELQNTPPVLDPADQALLDDIQSKSKAVAEKIKALDEQNPPTVPEV